MMKSKPLEASQLVRGRGRPPKDPTKGMRRNCTFRLPDNTRDKLLLAAVASNRTLSEEIEWRVEQWVALQGARPRSSNVRRRFGSTRPSCKRARSA